MVRDLEGNRLLYHIVGDNEMVCKNEVKKEEHLPCIEESNMVGKYDLERVLRRYKSAWAKLVEYDRNEKESK